MSLEGLRAWIGEVERKLGKRTRVFLVLTVIAIGISCASLYLAIDARNNSVSESDVQKLQEELEGRAGTGGAIETAPPPIETTPAPEPEPAPEGSGSQGGSGSSNGGASAGSADGTPNKAKIEELLKQAQKRRGQGE